MNYTNLVIVNSTGRVGKLIGIVDGVAFLRDAKGHYFTARADDIS